VQKSEKSFTETEHRGKKASLYQVEREKTPSHEERDAFGAPTSFLIIKGGRLETKGKDFSGADCQKKGCRHRDDKKRLLLHSRIGESERDSAKWWLRRVCKERETQQTKLTLKEKGGMHADGEKDPWICPRPAKTELWKREEGGGEPTL